MTKHWDSLSPQEKEHYEACMRASSEARLERLPGEPGLYSVCDNCGECVHIQVQCKWCKDTQQIHVTQGHEHEPGTLCWAGCA